MMHLASENISVKKDLTKRKIRISLPVIMKTTEQKSFTIGQLPEKAGGLAFRKDVTATVVPHEPPAFSGFILRTQKESNYGNHRN